MKFAAHNVMYVLGSCCFLAGSLISMWRGAGK